MRSHVETGCTFSARRTSPAQFVSLASHERGGAVSNSASADVGSMPNTPFGPGLEATLGARLAIGASHASDITLIVDERDEKIAGPSVSAVTTLQSWGVKTIHAAKVQLSGLVHCHSLPKKRAQNIWGLTKPLRTSSELKALLGSSSFHLQGSACDLSRKLEVLLSLRNESNIKAQLFVSWEPLDTSLSQLLAVSPQVDAIFLDIDQLELMLNSQTTAFDKQLVERKVQVLLDAGIGRNGQGIMAVQYDSSYLVASREDGFNWVPTFHSHFDVDASFATKALSVFLGGFTVKYLRSGDIREAALHGAVAESFAVEQQGLPRRGTSPYVAAAATFAARQYGLSSEYVPDAETWNMDSFKNRVRLLSVKVDAMTRVRQATLSRRLSGETLRNEDDLLIAEQ
ncbi:hypothetical protein SODALDRAFT_67746 [Sodiomyces alkalinus F11]|uniref:Uncharacterized protein n=1 Tax=Sodiomyces alkalinus (strain CBS 110278 / VKM F-3762 / F11) TaxID=1314773 RepID=A0A3N2PLT0_SODAK|nr:hypothetical protein SODALDRAFT_67746 [Sodiomyces alkalinus F11]ROT35483.1 hypothetical protein SODALDRAFT_67746 [Sodiomyces alkalinus F11]